MQQITKKYIQGEWGIAENVKLWAEVYQLNF